MDTQALYDFILKALTIITPVLLAYIAWRQQTMHTNMKQMEVNTNSKMDMLVAATASANLAEGKLSGRETMRQELKESTIEGHVN
jgi:hypothetical protein